MPVLTEAKMSFTEKTVTNFPITASGDGALIESWDEKDNRLTMEAESSRVSNVIVTNSKSISSAAI